MGVPAQESSSFGLLIRVAGTWSIIAAGRGAVSRPVMMRFILIIAGLAMSGMFDVRAQTNAPFTIQQKGRTAWLATPDGKKFFSLGVCVVNQGASRERFNPT